MPTKEGLLSASQESLEAWKGTGDKSGWCATMLFIDKLFEIVSLAERGLSSASHLLLLLFNVSIESSLISS